MTKPADDADDEIDPFLDRRHARRHRVRGRRSALRLGVLLLVCIGMLVVIVRLGRAIHLQAIVAGADAATDGQAWSTKELAWFLRRKGLIRRMDEVRPTAGTEMCTVGDGDAPTGSKTVTIVRMADAQAAARIAEDLQRARRPAFSWGRFYLTGDETLTTAIRLTLIGH